MRAAPCSAPFAVALPSIGRSPFAPTGPRDRPPPLLPPRAAASPRGERGLLQSKQVRRLAKFGLNPQAAHSQSPGWDRRSVPAWPPLPAPRWAVARRAPMLLPRDPSRMPMGRPPPPPPPPELRSTRSRSSRNPCRSVKSSASLPPAAPRRGGIAERAKQLTPPPPWCAATLRRAASSAMSARAACLCRLARRCQACSPRAVAARRDARRPEAARRPQQAVAEGRGSRGQGKRGDPRGDGVRSWQRRRRRVTAAASEAAARSAAARHDGGRHGRPARTTARRPPGRRRGSDARRDERRAGGPALLMAFPDRDPWAATPSLPLALGPIRL